MSRYLVTGGAGFIGSHLTRRLLDQGHAVTILDDLTTGRRLNLAGLEGRSGLEIVEASILDRPILDRAAAGKDGIFHLAAAVGVRLIVENPIRSMETNIRGTENVLFAAHAAKTPILLTSSSEVYGKGIHRRFHEEDDMLLGPTSKPRWSYAAAKAIDEFFALSYHHSRGLPVVIARLFNTVGPGQVGQYGMVIPRFIEQAKKGGPIRIYGDGTQTRCFCHVADVVEALDRLLADPRARGQVFNVGSEEEVSIADLARRIAEFAGTNPTTELVPYEAAYAPGFEDIKHRAPDTSKIRNLLGWKPKRTLDDILRELTISPLSA